MAWNLKGSYVETCSCELMCPCNLSFDHGATYDYCRATLVFTIATGTVEGVDIAGRRVAVIIDTPKVMTDGNWRLGMFIDDGASDEQFEKLSGVFSGQLGGPMAALGPLVGEVLGVETGEPVRFQGMFHPAGSNLTIAEATRSRINAFGIEYEGKTGLSTSDFSWAA